MNEIGIYRGLEVELASIPGGLPTVFDNSNTAPPAGAHQLAYVMLAKPENPTQDDDFYRQRGYLQIASKFPQNTGPGEAREHALMLREHFHNGLSIVSEGVTTIVAETPEIGSGSNDGDHYVINVFVRFYADIFRSLT